MTMEQQMTLNNDLQERWKIQIHLTCCYYEVYVAFMSSFTPVFKVLLEALTNFSEAFSSLFSEIVSYKKLSTSYQQNVDNFNESTDS